MEADTDMSAAPHILVYDGPHPPAADMVHHSGSPAAPDCDLFIDPPAEIGAVLTCDSSLHVDVRPIAGWIRMSAIFGSAAAAIIAMLLLLQSYSGYPAPLESFQTFLAFVVGMWAALYAHGLTRFKHTCTYVGKEGIARFVCAGSRGNIVSREILVFKNAVALKVSKASGFRLGVYPSVRVEYVWRGTTRFVLKWKDVNLGGEPEDPSHAYYFARSAERAWREHFLIRGG